MAYIGEGGVIIDLKIMSCY